MPTQVRPDDPTATTAARTQAMVGGPRDPGTPSTAGKPGVQAGRPGATPAPPAPATAPVGKPPDGARAAMGGTPTPGAPTPAAGAPAQAATATPAAAPPTQPGAQPPASAAGSSTTKGVGAPEAPAAPAQPAVDAAGNPVPTMPMSPTVPPPGSLVPGAQVQTPFGVASAGPDGRQSVALDANGQQRFKESMAALRSKFTLPKVMKGMQGLPAMELKLGASNFDPFTGRYHGRD